MAISKDLFTAILAMDAYNRGYESGINFGPNADAAGTRIGDATVIRSKGDAEAQSSGFYGIAYNTSAVTGFTAGETTIAYRGTDRLIPNSVFGSDLWNAYGVGRDRAGNIRAMQADRDQGRDSTRRLPANYFDWLDLRVAAVAFRGNAGCSS
jgi:hypothetical protein